MSLWEQRAARNEALFREVNERVEELHDRLESDGTDDFVCECPDDACTERVPVALETYERAQPPGRGPLPGRMGPRQGLARRDGFRCRPCCCRGDV